MITDFATTPLEGPLNADLCIIGAGAAGISMAREFAGGPFDVLLVESGPFDYDDRTQELYEGESNHQDLMNSRLRYFGGTTNHFVGESSPLDAIDFEIRDWVADSGWPIDRITLDAYYPRAQDVMQMGPHLYDERAWDAVGMKPHAFDPDRLKTYFVQYSGHIKEGYWDWQGPVRFGTAYRAELERAGNIKALVNANVTDIRPGADNATIEEVEVRSLDGRRAMVRARAFVLACGGIETARLMLNSRSRADKGIGNEHDLVGRYFGSHPYADLGVLMAKQPEQMADLYSRFKKIGQAKTRAALRLGENAQAREKLLNISVYLVGEDDMSSGVGAATEAWRQIKSFDFDTDFAKQLWSALKDIDDVGAQYLRARQGKAVVIPVKPAIKLWAISEWAPYPDSRVQLSDDKDELGLNRVYVDDHIGEMEIRTFKQTAKITAAELTRLGLGRVRLDDWILANDGSWKDALVLAGAHHFGTTRMADDPRKGVVDADCKVHSLSNLFVASSAVFPTNGYANPTISIVTLALRLADHLKEVLKSPT